MFALSLCHLMSIASTTIKTVHVINSCHLDLGFADSAAGIVNRYFDHHLPMAAAVGAELATSYPGYTDHKLNFMFQSWVLDLYFDCPPDMGVHCPSSAQKDVVRSAIVAVGNARFERVGNARSLP